MKLTLTIAFFLISFTSVLLVCAQPSNKQCIQFNSLSDSIYYSNPDSAFSLSCLAEKCAAQAKDSSTLAKAFVGKGKYLLLKSMLEEAGAELNKAEIIYSSKRDTLGLAKVLNLKSIIMQRVGNQDESVKLLEQSYRLYKQLNKLESVYSVLLNLSIRYASAGMLENSRRVFQELDSLEEFKTKTNIYYYNQNRGSFELSLKNYDEAERYFKLACAYAQTNKMIDSEATILMLLARNSRLKGDYKKAEALLTKSKQLSIENNLDHELLETYSEFVLLFRQTSDYKSAFEYQLLKEELSKKLINLDRVNKIASLEKKFAISQKQKEVDLEKANAAAEQSRSKTFLLLLIVICVVLLLVGALFVRTQKLKNKLHIQNLIVETKQREILDSIHYAKRIQRVLMASEQTIERSLNRLKNNAGTKGRKS